MTHSLHEPKGYKYGKQKIYPHFKDIRDHDVYEKREYETDKKETSLYDDIKDNINEKNKANDEIKKDSNNNNNNNNKYNKYNKYNNNKYYKYNDKYSNNYDNSYSNNDYDIPINNYLKRKRKKRIYSKKKKYIFKKKTLVPFDHVNNNIQNDATNSDTYLQSFVIKKKTTNVPLNNKYIENSNIELKNKSKHTLNPALSLMASRAVDGLLGGVHKHMQGTIAISSDGNNSPLANQIVTPNVYGSPNSISPINMTNNIAPLTSNPSPTPPSPLAQSVGTSISPTTVTTNIPGGAPIGSPNIMSQGMVGGVATPPGVQVPNNAIPFNPMNPTNLMPLNQIGQNPAFNIHPTASNLRGDPGNVNYNEVVSITIGIVLSLVLFCFIFGCLTKLCKPKKRRR
ncbi:conserved Plasmodium protein, unknown function [Plasmodium reichenowi]|uniref:Uncharacterized protein n=1 Tax=Plasmodium reichenowi TaxID=5854 RepID=A0A060RUJ4_PLARE|nr:conserved Plasmodium protein, unknown function [Plasmodium reichenowi]